MNICTDCNGRITDPACPSCKGEGLANGTQPLTEAQIEWLRTRSERLRSTSSL